MRLLFLFAAMLIAAPAFADDTLKTVTSRGAVIVTGGQDLEITFTPDGKYTVASVLDGGSWRIQGDKLCTRSASSGLEDCAVYPAGKASGDTFTLKTQTGDVTLRIK